MQKLVRKIGLISVLMLLLSTVVLAADPIAQPDNYQTPFGQTLNVAAPGVLGNDSDADGDTLSAVVTSNPLNGSLRFNSNGGFSYEPNMDFMGQDTFTYRATDGTSTSNSVTVTILVGSSQPPLAESDNYTMDAGITLEVPAPGVLGNDTDPDSETLIAVSPTNPANGTLTLREDGSFSYLPNAGFSGSDTFTYRASDGVNLSNTTLVTIVVNQRVIPVANNDMYEMSFNSTLVVDVAQGVRANDTNVQEGFNAVLVTAATSGTLSLNNDGSFVYTPFQNFVGPETFSYKLSGNGAESNVATVSIRVLAPSPSGLLVQGNLNQGIVRPQLSWIRPIINPGNIPVPIQWYQIIVKDANGVTIIDKWTEIANVCNPIGAERCGFNPSAADLPVGFRNGNYTWQVRSWGNNVFSAFSNLSTFTVNIPLPVLQSFSVSAETGRPVLTLPNDPNTAYFQVFIGTADLQQEHLQWYQKTESMCATGPCILIPDVFLSNGSYTVYVQAWGPAGYNGNDQNVWQGPQNFSLNATAPQVINGLNVSVTNGVPTFTWQGSDALTWYQIWVGAAGTPPVQQLTQWYQAVDLNCAGGGTCTLTPNNLTVGVGINYIWYLRGWGPDGFTTGGVQGWTEGPNFTP